MTKEEKTADFEINYEKGKNQCRRFKEMRRTLADANGIEFEEKECTNPEPCTGTCPYCDAKTRELEAKLYERSFPMIPSVTVNTNNNMSEDPKWSNWPDSIMENAGCIAAPEEPTRERLSVEELTKELESSFSLLDEDVRIHLEELQSKM